MPRTAVAPKKARKTRAKSPGPRRGKVTLERIFKASLDETWDLWTTSAGLESWWGPYGFVTKVRSLDLRPGGTFEYAMKATDDPQVEALTAAGLPLLNIGRSTYTEVVPRSRLAYRTTVDFVPGVANYEITTVVELHDSPAGVRLTLTQDEMHDIEWTQQAALGLDQQLSRLVKVIQDRQTESR